MIDSPRDSHIQLWVSLFTLREKSCWLIWFLTWCNFPVQTRPVCLLLIGVAVISVSWGNLKNERTMRISWSMCVMQIAAFCSSQLWTILLSRKGCAERNNPVLPWGILRELNLSTAASWPDQCSELILFWNFRILCVDGCPWIPHRLFEVEGFAMGYLYPPRFAIKSWLWCRGYSNFCLN